MSSVDNQRLSASIPAHRIEECIAELDKAQDGRNVLMLSCFRDAAKALRELQALRASATEGEPMAWASCPSCNGTGDLGGNPSYGMCPDCDGKGKLPAPAQPSLVDGVGTLSRERLSFLYALLGSEHWIEAGTIWDQNPEEREAAYSEVRAALSHTDGEDGK